MGTLLQDAITAFLQSQRGVHAPRTIKWYTLRLRALEPIGDMDVDDVRPSHLQEIWTSLVDRPERWSEHPCRPTKPGGLSAFTLHGYVRAWQAFFRWCIVQEYCERNPARALRKPKLPTQLPKGITYDNMLRMLAVAQADARDYAIVCFLADTGCRVGGLVGLHVDDLDLEHRRAVVHEKGRGGNGKARVVYLKARTVGALQRYLAARTEQSEKVFCGRRGPLGGEGVYRVLQRLARKAGVAGYWNPHAFRHGFARGAINKGADLSTVSALLGHESVTVTGDFYARWADEELAQKHEQVSWLPDEE